MSVVCLLRQESANVYADISDIYERKRSRPKKKKKKEKEPAVGTGE